MTETGGLSQSFDYDRYGNRFITSGFVQDEARVPHITQLKSTLPAWYDQDTNKLKTENYDATGNVIKDTTGTNPGNSFDYDSENKQVRFHGGATAGGTDYNYDGDGRRVKKVSGMGQQTTIFVYDAMGKMVAEYDTNPPSGSGGTSYFTADNLGTPRIITGADQSVKARHDYLPFGEEIAVGVGGRTGQTGQKYVYGEGDDKVRQKFTQKERDVETGLDYFGARYYSSAQGRFTSPDEFTGGPDELYDFVDDASENPTFYADPWNPQSLNKYQYAYNNPLRYVDPDGHESSSLDEPDPEPCCKPVLGQVAIPVEVPVEPISIPILPSDQQRSGRSRNDRIMNPTIGDIGQEAVQDGAGQTFPIGLAGEAAVQGGAKRRIIPAPLPEFTPPYWPGRTSWPAVAPQAPPSPTAGHRRNRRKSNEEKHQGGNRRRQKDQGGEKADPVRKGMPFHKSKPPKWKGPWPPKPKKPPETNK